jgi:hypothetical protein
VDRDTKQSQMKARRAWPPLMALCCVLASCGPSDWRDSKKTDPGAQAGAEAQPAAPDLGQGASAPSLPQWAEAYIGKNPRESFPRNGLCIGNTDLVQSRFGGASPGTSIVGWGWDTQAKARVQRVILVDLKYQIVGAGEGGLSREDVPPARPEVTDGKTGWRAVTSLTAGPVEAYGVVDDGRALCPLGRLEF